MLATRAFRLATLSGCIAVSRHDALDLFKGRRLPVVIGAEAAECGLACMTMIARWHGHDVDLNGLRQRSGLSISGASLRTLIQMADRLGLASRALKVEMEALSKVKTPAILHWDLNHFVVLANANARSWSSYV